MNKGVFVTGTDTDVGKTVAAACLVRALDADYWKPIQAGLDGGGDAETVRGLTGLAPERIHPAAYALARPRSPHEAARVEGVTISLDRFTLPTSTRPLVVEGAGGVLVPLNERDLMVDLMVRLGLPVVLVARSGLGTINHTLLSLEALRHRGLHVALTIMSGPPDPENRAALERYGQVPVKEIVRLAPLDAAAIAHAAETLVPRGGGLFP